MALDYTFAPWSGVGIMSLYPKDIATGLPSGGGFDLGEGSKLSINQQAPKLEMPTSRSADRGVAFSMAQSKAASVAIEVLTLSDPLKALLMSGVWTETAATAAVVGWVAPAGIVVNQIIKVPAQNISAVVVKDSAGAPATVAAAKYEIDLVGGTIKMLDIAGFTQPFKVDYTPGAIKTLGAFKAADADMILHFNGTNARDGKRGILEAYKFRPSAEGEVAWIMTEWGTYQINGSLQKDETKLSGSAGGQYYKWVEVGP